MRRWSSLLPVLAAVALSAPAAAAAEPSVPTFGGQVIVGVGASHADNHLDPFTADAVDPGVGTYAVIVRDEHGEDRAVLIGFAGAPQRERFAQLPFAAKCAIADAVREGRPIAAEMTATALATR